MSTTGEKQHLEKIEVFVVTCGCQRTRSVITYEDPNYGGYEPHQEEVAYKFCEAHQKEIATLHAKEKELRKVLDALRVNNEAIRLFYRRFDCREKKIQLQKRAESATTGQSAKRRVTQPRITIKNICNSSVAIGYTTITPKLTPD
jgi:hypothetical protein